MLPEIQSHNADLLRRAFSGKDQDFGEYWEVFSQGTPEQIQSLCDRLSQKGFGEFQGQTDPTNPQSFVSRIIAGRSHSKFPKARREAQMRFLARYVAVGQYISDRTWKRSISRQDTDLLSSGELRSTPEIEWTEETD
jgi:hypothetical protein